MGRFTLNQRRTRGSGMTAEDGALREIEVAAASIIDDGLFFDGHRSLGQEGLAAVVDEDIDARAIDEDDVRRFRRVNEGIRVVDQIHIGAEP